MKLQIHKKELPDELNTIDICTNNKKKTDTDQIPFGTYRTDSCNTQQNA